MFWAMGTGQSDTRPGDNNPHISVSVILLSSVHTWMFMKVEEIFQWSRKKTTEETQSVSCRRWRRNVFGHLQYMSSLMKSDPLTLASSSAMSACLIFVNKVHDHCLYFYSIITVLCLQVAHSVVLNILYAYRSVVRNLALSILLLFFCINNLWSQSSHIFYCALRIR